MCPIQYNSYYFAMQQKSIRLLIGNKYVFCELETGIVLYILYARNGVLGIIRATCRILEEKEMTIIFMNFFLRRVNLSAYTNSIFHAAVSPSSALCYQSYSQCYNPKTDIK
jgi:hypothetical protein